MNLKKKGRNVKKLKRFMKNHANDILVIASYAGVAAVAYNLGKSNTQKKCNAGWQITHGNTRTRGENVFIDVFFRNGKSQTMKQTITG